MLLYNATRQVVLLLCIERHIILSSMIGEDGFNFVLVVNMRLESGIDIADEVVLLRNKNGSIRGLHTKESFK